jgi:hypothetical protein
MDIGEVGLVVYQSSLLLFVSNFRKIALKKMALDCWRKHMIEPLKEKLIKLLLDSIDRDRKGESVNQSVIHGVINSLVDVADKRQKTLVVNFKIDSNVTYLF